MEGIRTLVKDKSIQIHLHKLFMSQKLYEMLHLFLLILAIYS
jgi:hypothetical protein